MDAVNKTLYIPLYSKAFVSRKGILLQDPKAEQIWDTEGFPLKGKSKSKWLTYYMGMRSAVFDRWVTEKTAEHPDAVVLHLGCGLDSRVLRVKEFPNPWYDVDFPEVIRERQRHFAETGHYHMISSDVRELSWLNSIPGETAIVVMEGISMYLKPEELSALLAGLKTYFKRICLLMDCYTEFAAKASRIRNPINDVGVTQVYGLDDPTDLEVSGLTFLREHDMTPEYMIAQLSSVEQIIFRTLYAGKMSKNLYRMYEYKT